MGFEPLLPWWLVVAAALAGAAGYAIRRDRPRESAARAAGLFFLAWLGLNPVRRNPERVPVRPRAFIALDSSRSMAERDEGGRSRWKAADGALRSSRPMIESLKKLCELHVVTFDGSVRDGLKPRPDGPKTDLRGLISRTRELAGLECTGLVVLSDGKHNCPGDPVEEAATAGFPQLRPARRSRYRGSRP